MDTQQTLSPLTIALHWIVTLTLITLIGIGFYMSWYEVYRLYDWHKSFGVLIVGAVLMPISGMMYSSLGGYGIKVFGWAMVPGNKNAEGQAEPFHAGLSSLGQFTHEWLGYLLAGAIILHIAGALKHCLINKDCTLSRTSGCNGR
jgi:cytochrome b561